MHGAIYRRLGAEVIPVDPAIPGSPDIRALKWDDIVVDVCAPTAVHTECVMYAYRLGARRFIVEKPAAPDAQSWDELLVNVPDAEIFVVHNYLFSRAYRLCRDLLVDPVEVITVFNKDRAADDNRGRGAGPDGRLPHLLLVEAPHQFSILLDLFPDLRVRTTSYRVAGGRAADRHAPIAGRVTLADPGGRHAVLHTSLRQRRLRVVRVHERDGRTLTVRFPVTADQISRVIEHRPDGTAHVLLEGVDDLLATTLRAALHAFRTGEIPRLASTAFARSVLECIDQARQPLAPVPATPTPGLASGVRTAS